MNAASNPYRPAPGSQPPYLAGRGGEISAVGNAVIATQHGGSASPIVFTGLRGMGKTALLRRTLHRARQAGAVVLYAEASQDQQLEDAFRASLSRARQETEGAPGRLSKALDAVLARLPSATYELPHALGGVTLKGQRRAADHAPFAQTLADLNDAAWEQDRFLVIAIDEIQSAPTVGLLAPILLVHETAGTNRPALFLGAGLPDTGEHLKRVRTYTERWSKYPLGLLSQQDAMKAIAEPAFEHGVTIQPDALETLARLTAGYPFFIQEYASAVWARHVGDVITIDDVAQAAPGVQKHLDVSFYADRFRSLTPREVRYALALADLGEDLHGVDEVARAIGLTVQAASSTRNQLVKKDVIFAPSPGLVEFRMPLTGRYVEANREALEKRARLSAR